MSLLEKLQSKWDEGDMTGISAGIGGLAFLLPMIFGRRRNESLFIKSFFDLGLV